ncbi:DUF3347 domain-containing protein [Flavobacteriaceae bacterium KMM 6897]|nr:DUF3347 domain-containing protein [Flavobacteriaceae bacterium KMM 6897]
MNNSLNSVVVMLLLVVTSINAQEKNKKDHGKMNMDGMKMDIIHTAPEFNDANLASSYDHYIHIKNALVNSDVNEAKKGVAMLVKVLIGIKGSGVVEKAANEIKNTDDLNVQRVAFSNLSNAMEMLLKGNLKSGTIYKDYCPMALKEGAYWMSSEKEIQNPYYGDKMLTCGTVKETIQ